ncbi:MAG TPA: hypothetical protein VFA68_22230 [Terriglobales bacterium]|nr:hypothetical protein [Terriglobales bacterium]
MLEHRTESRLPAEIEIRIAALSEDGTPFAQTALARNISLSGGLLTGLQRKLRSGDLMRVQYRDSQARFRVVWTGSAGRNGPFSAAVHKLKEESCPWAELLIECASK